MFRREPVLPQRCALSEYVWLLLYLPLQHLASRWWRIRCTLYSLKLSQQQQWYISQSTAASGAVLWSTFSKSKQAHETTAVLLDSMEIIHDAVPIHATAVSI